jgi:hypothetical protein
VVAGGNWKIEAGMDGKIGSGTIERDSAGNFCGDAACVVRRDGAREVFEIYVSRFAGGTGRFGAEGELHGSALCVVGDFGISAADCLREFGKSDDGASESARWRCV